MLILAEKVTAAEASSNKFALAVSGYSSKTGGEGAQEEVFSEVSALKVEAEEAVGFARKSVVEQLKQVVNYTAAQRATVTQELTTLRARSEKCFAEVTRRAKDWSHREQNAAAVKVLQELTSGAEKLEADLENVQKVGNRSLLAANKFVFLTGMLSQSFATALAAASETIGGVGAILKEITPNEKATQDEFLAFLDRFASEHSGDGTCFSPERSIAIFKHLTHGQGELTAEHVKDMFRERLTCSRTVPLFSSAEGGEAAGSLEVGEVIEVVEPLQDNPLGLMQCVLCRDATRMWAARRSGEESNFELSVVGSGQLESIEALANVLHARCQAMFEYSDRKVQEASALDKGALADAKQKIVQQRMKVNVFRSKVDQLRKRIAVARGAVVQQSKDELQKSRELWYKGHLTRKFKEVSVVVEAAEGKASKVIESVKVGSVFKNKDKGVLELESLRRDAAAAIKGLEEARRVLQDFVKSQEGYKGPGHTSSTDIRVKLMSLTSRVNSTEKKTTLAAEQVRTAHAQRAKVALESARKSLKAAVGRTCESSDALFDKHAAGKENLTEELFRELVQALPDHGLTEEHIVLLFGDFGGSGLRRPEFAKETQGFCVLSAPVQVVDASGSSFELETGELLEVMEAAVGGATESRVRVISSGIIGLASIGGGVAKFAEKPYMQCVAPGELCVSLDGGHLRPLKIEEMLELLEGPTTYVETPEPETEVRLYGLCNGVKGWLVAQDAVGTTVASLSEKTYVCKKTIAITDSYDIRSGKAKRKIQVGELLQATEDVEKSPESGPEMVRLHVKVVKDGVEGWVTTKGSNGTVFVEASSKHWNVQADAVLRAGEDETSEVVASLKAGDIFEVAAAAEVAKEETKRVVRVRSLDDCATGWIVSSSGDLPVKFHAS